MNEVNAAHAQITLDLRAEINGLVKIQKEHDDAAFKIQKECHALERKLDKKKSLSEEEEKRANSLHRQLVSRLSSGTTISEKLINLRQEGELERRIAAHDRKITAAQTSKERAHAKRTEKVNGKVQEKLKKMNAREQGVPEVYLSENGNFKPGHDSKLKSDLVACATGQTGKLYTFKKKDALALLEKRDWMKYLIRKQEAK